MKKILVVDDEELVINALTKRLTKEGFSIDVARDGDEALEKAESVNPDLILLDIVMPKLDGISVLKKLKESAKTQNIPVIMLTNLYEDQKLGQAMKAGVSDYLVKVDHTLNDIVKRIRNKLN